MQINTPHAAVIVWNYNDRLGSAGVKSLNEVEATIISTLSLVSITTNKQKSAPQGTFQLVLAPTKNWVSTLTTGSWCAILMSNEPIAEADFKKASAQKIKMIGKIESVRVTSSMDQSGNRTTQYLVSGVDWGHIFNNTVYIDNNIQNENDPQTQGQGIAIAIRDILFGDDGVPDTFGTNSNLKSIINIFGQGLGGITQSGDEINRLAKATYNFIMPRQMVEYFNFVGPSGTVSKDLKLNNVITLFSGKLKSEDLYDNEEESEGFLDPFSFQGTNTFWQLLMDNGNQSLNEMFCDLRWEGDPKGRSGSQLRLALYNRIKPFAIKGRPVKDSNPRLRSFFQNIRTHEISSNEVINVNAGTNWRDKYNFVEIKPSFQDFNMFQNWYKQKSQQSDPKAFEREGFRPLIFQTKQFPKGNLKNGEIDWNELANWSKILKEWYFDTHKMLNGTLTITGQSRYIAVGDNIMFSADIINPTANLNKASHSKKKNEFVLAHVENVSHSFSVSQEGARTYTTSIQFVRGILVNASKSIVGDGVLDTFSSELTTSDDKNTKNVFATSDSQDPDPQKVRGT